MTDLERIINTIPDPVFVKDRRHVWVLLNDAYCRFMGFERDLLIGKSDYDFFPKEEADVFWARDEVVFETAQENTNDEEFTDSKGVIHFITTKKSLYENPVGEKFIVGCIRDVTALRLAQIALQDARDRLEITVDERTAELAATNDALQRQIIENQRTAEQLRHSQKMEAVGRLAGGIAHDFNNLLNIIIGYAVQLQNITCPDEVRRSTEHIVTAAERAASLTRQLLAFSRKQVLKPEVLDVGEILSSMGRFLPPLLGEDIELTVVNEAKSPCIEADRGQIEQVIMNLAVNARDAMPQGGTLTVESRNVELPSDDAAEKNRARRFLLLSVTDTGEGMDPETQVHMFEPFFTTKGPGKGTGLGLATVYAIVTQSGGEIKVHSELGKGTTIGVYLPCKLGNSPVQKQYEIKGGEGSGSETILLVEDEESLRKLLCAVLQAKGYKVLDAASGSAALKLAESNPEPIHLLVTDVIMPGMRGWELAKKLSATRADLRVLYISGHTDPHSMGDASELSPEDLLSKPFRPVELLKRVHEILSRGPGSIGTTS